MTEEPLYLESIADRSSVYKAGLEYDELGEDRFLAKYAIAPDHGWWVKVGLKLYPAKALACAAWTMEHPEYLDKINFHTRDACRQLNRLEFECAKR